MLSVLTVQPSATCITPPITACICTCRARSLAVREVARGIMLDGGWGETHPFSAMNGLGTDNADLVMLWGARTEEELEIVWLFVQVAYSHARGLLLTRERHAYLTNRYAKQPPSLAWIIHKDAAFSCTSGCFPLR